MQKVRVITTSGCDLSYKEAEQNNIIMVPDWVISGDTQYRNNIDILPEDFYRRITIDKKLPTSAHPSPAQMIEAFQQASDAEEIICIVGSSKMTGAFNTASFTAQQLMEDGFPSRIHVFDSLGISLGMGILVLDAARMAASGASADKILAYLHERVSRIGLYFVMNTLEYARKGGRIGAITALATDTLGVKPLLTFHDGIVSDLSLNRTLKSGIRAIYKKYEALADDNPEVFIFHADNEKGARQLKSMIEEHDPDIHPRIAWVGPAVGLYSGPGCVGIAFRKKEA